jgi:hypothetical protein
MKRAWQLQTLYGITVQEYDLLLNKQDNQCAICGTEACMTGRVFAVDHNHDTGEVRGLLCGKCNIGLGQFSDNPALLVRAAAYLERR